MTTRDLSRYEQVVCNALEKNPAHWEHENKCGGMTVDEICALFSGNATDKKELEVLLEKMCAGLQPILLKAWNDKTEKNKQYFRYYLNRNSISPEGKKPEEA